MGVPQNACERPPPRAELIVAHSSDLHIGGRTRATDALWTLRSVLAAAREARAHVLILAGDVFDSHRVGDAVLERVAKALSAPPFDVVILPGNHDPATPDAVYRRAALDRIANVHILGVTTDGIVRFPHLELEVTGVPHLAYTDMRPLPRARKRAARWHIVVAHGHWVTGPQDAHRGWLIHDADIAATGADYVALGHWDRAQRAGDGEVAAYYSGSPEVARTLNIVRLGESGVDVRRQPLRMD